MDRKRFSILALGFLLIPYAFVYGVNFRREKSLGFLANFTDHNEFLLSIIGLTLLVGLVWSAQRTPAASAKGEAGWSKIWGMGFGLILVLALGLAWYVNPHARFLGERFPSVTVAARMKKIKLYQNMETAPGVVILGSSRAFTISPHYIKEQTGYETFNLAVESGGVGDYAIQLNTILHSDHVPTVLLIEVNHDTFGYIYPNIQSQPVALLPYMDAEVAAWSAQDTIQDVFGWQSLSDSFYSLFISRYQKPDWTMDPLDNGFQDNSRVTHEEYVNLLKEAVNGPARNHILCNSVNAKGVDALGEVLLLAQENHIGVVLYESPINADFYKRVSKTQPKKFDQCRALIRSTLESFSASYENVFVRDLSTYEPISALGEKGYYDHFHLRPTAANQVIDALLSEIQSAIAWSVQESAK